MIVQAIRRLAQDPDSVRVTVRAGADFRRFRVTRYDVCDALIAWIDAQKPMEEIVTTEVRAFRGDPAYVARPLFEGVEFYVKVTVYGDPDTNEEMLIISTHPA